ncbi:MAG: ElyC/SanA/YdcF family protein [Legionella sp.]|nr:ElyC/SanA/YdcF family protein [Legionella sp.]
MIINGVQAASCRQFFEYLFNPMFWMFFVLLCCIIYLLWPGQTRRAKRLGCVVLFFLLVFFVVSTPWLPNWMLSRFENQFTRLNTVDVDVPFVVVLGGGAASNLSIPAGDALSNASVRRMLEGVRLYQALPHAKLILSGGSRDEPKYAEAVRFDALAEAFHIPKADRVLEADSINTRDEARLIKPIVGKAPFYLVTSALHMARSMQLFEKQGLHPIAAPCNYIVIKSETKKSWMDYLPSAINLLRFNAAWHECLGQLWAACKQLG